MTRKLRFALLGDNVSYSRSSDIFEEIFRLAGIDGCFDVCSVGHQDLRAGLNELVIDGVRGISVTIPHKEAVIEFLHDIDPVAQALGAVNFVCVEEARLYGYNTDRFGFALPLKPSAEKLKYARALILGCGGSARAVVYSLYVDFEVKRFTVAGRTEKKLRQFKTALEDRLGRIQIDTVSLGDTSLENGGTWDIVVNCTPLGGWNHRRASPLPKTFDFRRSKIYYDLNYNNGNSVVEAARQAGVIAIDGSAMLVGQAIRSFDIWTGQRVRFEPVYKAVFGHP